MSVHPKETLSLITRDGVRLDADVYRPVGMGPFPVLLMRQPYGRAIASTVVYAHPRWYASHGYIVVIQDVRGRGSSEGEFRLFSHEVEDGWETVNWAASLPHSTGDVGMYGFSYQGMTQLYAAAAHPPALKVLCPSMVGYDLYRDWAYEGGAFCLQTNLAWAIQLAAETARRAGNEAAFLALYRAAQELPLMDGVTADPEILKTWAPDSFYHEWLSHPEAGDYWQELSPQLTGVDLPMLHIGGWFDPYLRGTIRLYREMVGRSRYPQHLWIGPWAHLPWSRRVGTVDFGPEAVSPIDRVQIRWFDRFLKKQDLDKGSDSVVWLFEMGRNRWCGFPQWPQDKEQTLFLATTGLANLQDGGGVLVHEPGTDEGQDWWVHDPWRPVPSVGGHATLPAGPFDRAGVDSRADVVTYTSGLFVQPWLIRGEGRVELFCGADAPSFDICAVVSEVLPSGVVLPLTQGYLRVAPVQVASVPAVAAPVVEAPGEKEMGDRPTHLSPTHLSPTHLSPTQAQWLTISLQATCGEIQPGSALRLSVSGACFPAYTVNPGTGEQPEKARRMEAQVITLGIWSGGDRPSRLVLPSPTSPQFSSSEIQ